MTPKQLKLTVRTTFNRQKSFTITIGEPFRLQVGQAVMLLTLTEQTPMEPITRADA